MKVFLLVVLFPLLAFAQDFPTKPIRLIVPFGPGGVADITARSVAPEISRALGQSLVIENKPSAGGVVAGQEAARAASRSEAHTSELQSPCNIVYRLLLEKKKEDYPQSVLDRHRAQPCVA